MTFRNNEMVDYSGTAEDRDRIEELYVGNYLEARMKVVKIRQDAWKSVAEKRRTDEIWQKYYEDLLERRRILFWSIVLVYFLICSIIRL